MAYLARTITPADGATDLFPVSFPLPPIQGREGTGIYVHRATDLEPGNPLTEGVDYSWVSDGQISFLPGRRPSAGMVVDVRRQTDIQTIDNTIQSGGSLRSSELAQNDQQLLYLLQERSDENADLKALLAQAVEVFSRDAPSSRVNVKNFGAVGDGITNDSAAFDACKNFLKLMAKNPSSGGFYTGTPEMFMPAGRYFLGTYTLELDFTVMLSGEGHGWVGVSGGSGSTCLVWSDNVPAGIRTIHPLTSGNTAVDLITHKGSGGAFLQNFCMQGAYSGAESDSHGLDLRAAAKCLNLYIKNFSGEGIKGWAGNITGFGNVSGNLSTSLFIGVKCEGNRGGCDLRGTETNVITLINCEGYQNRWFGFLDDNGGGSNTYIGCHCASNGLISFVGVYTQCSTGGRQFALRWGGNPLNAPPASANDNADWYYVQDGAPIANLIPAYAATPGLFRAGGDYMTINGASVLILNCYSELGGFSQFTVGTLVDHGAMTQSAFRGGSRWVPGSDGLHLQLPASGNLYLQTRTGETGLWITDQFGTVFGYIDWVQGGGVYINSHTGMNIRIDGATVTTIDASGVALGAGQVLKNNGLQVLGARRTGWAAATGVADRTTFDQAAVTLPELAKRVKALIDDGLAHGHIGA